MEVEKKEAAETRGKKKQEPSSLFLGEVEIPHQRQQQQPLCWDELQQLSFNKHQPPAKTCFTLCLMMILTHNQKIVFDNSHFFSQQASCSTRTKTRTTNPVGPFVLR